MIFFVWFSSNELCNNDKMKYNIDIKCKLTYIINCFYQNICILIAFYTYEYSYFKSNWFLWCFQILYINVALSFSFIARNIKRELQYRTFRCYSCDVQTLRNDGNNFFAAAHKLLQLHVNVSSFMRPFRDHNGRFGDL